MNAEHKHLPIVFKKISFEQIHIPNHYPDAPLFWTPLFHFEVVFQDVPYLLTWQFETQHPNNNSKEIHTERVTETPHPSEAFKTQCKNMAKIMKKKNPFIFFNDSGTHVIFYPAIHHLDAHKKSVQWGTLESQCVQTKQYMTYAKYTFLFILFAFFVLPKFFSIITY